MPRALTSRTRFPCVALVSCGVSPMSECFGVHSRRDSRRSPIGNPLGKRVGVRVTVRTVWTSVPVLQLREHLLELLIRGLRRGMNVDMHVRSPTIPLPSRLGTHFLRCTWHLVCSPMSDWNG